MQLDAQTVASLLEPFTKAFCVRYDNGNVFVVGTTVVVILVTTECLCIVDVMPQVTFNEKTIEGPWGEIAGK